MAHITIGTTSTRVNYTVSGGSTTTFAIPYEFFDVSDLVVRRTSGGSTATLTYNASPSGVTQYSVTGLTTSEGGFDGGTVTLGAAASDGDKFAITLNMTPQRDTDFPTAGTFNINTLNTWIDKIFLLFKQQKDAIELKMGRPTTSTETYSLDWPDGATTDPKALVMSTDAGLEIGPTTTEISNAQTYASNASTSATAAASSASTASGHVTTASNYAVKVDGAVTGSDYSAKAWSVGGTGVTDTSSAGAAKEWSIETSGTVDGTSYSAKEYAHGTQASTGGAANSWSQDADQVNGASTNDRSAKAWSQGASMTGSTLGGSSKDWAQLTSGTVDGTNYSAKYHANAAAASATAAASGQIYSTVANQTSATLSPALSADGTYYLCDTSSNNITVTLPEIGTTEGAKLAFQKTHASNSLIFQRSGSDTLNGSASNITLTDVNSQIVFVSDNNSPDNWVGTNLNQVTAGTGISKTGSVISVDINGLGAETTIDHAADHVAVLDATDSAVQKMTVANLLQNTVQQGTHTIWVPAAAMRPTVSNGCAAITDAETTAGRPDMQVLDFDASADEHAQFQISFPKSWNEGTITFSVYWTTTATDTDGVAWGLQGVAVSDNDTIDVAYGTGVVVTDDALGAAEDLMVTATSGAVTIAGSPAVGDICYFRIYRDIDNGNDDMAEDARLIGCKIYYTVDAKDDS